MHSPFSTYERYKMNGWSSSKGIFLANNAVNIGEKPCFISLFHIIAGFFIGLPIILGANQLFMLIWHSVFPMTNNALFFSFLSFFATIFFDTFLGSLFVIVIMPLIFLPSDTKKFHAIEHKIINLIRHNWSINRENIKKSNHIDNNCGVNIAALFTLANLLILSLTFFVQSVLFSAFFTIFTTGALTVLFLGLVLHEHRFSAFGKFLQKYLFTKRPDDKHLAFALTLCRNFFKKGQIYSTQKRLAQFTIQQGCEINQKRVQDVVNG